MLSSGDTLAWDRWHPSTMEGPQLHPKGAPEIPPVPIFGELLVRCSSETRTNTPLV